MPHTSSNRPLRRAQLLEVELQWTRSIVQPIFDPHIIGIDGHSTVLQGVEIECCGDDTAEHIQVWHCTPLTDPSAP